MLGLYEKVVSFVSMMADSKVMKISDFTRNARQNPRWPPYEAHGTFFFTVNIVFCLLDKFCSLKK